MARDNSLPGDSPKVTDNLAQSRGQTPREVARLLRVGVGRVMSWIKSGALKAINTADATSARPRYVVLPHHLDEFERARSAADPPKPKRAKRRMDVIDFFPNL
jgi:hypothetical protein